MPPAPVMRHVLGGAWPLESMPSQRAGKGAPPTGDWHPRPRIRNFVSLQGNRQIKGAMMRTSYLFAVAALVAGAGFAPPALAQDGSGTFVLMLGRDTVAVERYARTGNRIEGEILGRVPRTSRTSYVATLGSDGALSQLDITRRAPASDSVTQRVTVRFTADSAISEVQGARGAQRRAAAVAPGALPFIGNSFAMHELALQRARGAGRDSASVTMYPPGNADAWTMHVRRSRGDSIAFTIALPGGEIAHEGRADAQGRIQELRGVRGSYGSNVSRAAQVDMAALRRDFEARDAAGRALGELSPRDTTNAQVGGASIMIDYSRPSARGRTLLGGLLHEGTVWRLGANQATHFRTDRDLVFGTDTVPAGTYTLFALPGRETWTLIVNRQTGQWGTMYDQSQDLVRIPMRVSRAATPQEQFTIAVEPSGTGGVLRVSWGDIVAAAPFTVR